MTINLGFNVYDMPFSSIGNPSFIYKITMYDIVDMNDQCTMMMLVDDVVVLLVVDFITCKVQCNSWKSVRVNQHVFLLLLLYYKYILNDHF